MSPSSHSSRTSLSGESQFGEIIIGGVTAWWPHLGELTIMWSHNSVKPILSDFSFRSWLISVKCVTWWSIQIDGVHKSMKLTLRLIRNYVMIAIWWIYNTVMSTLHWPLLVEKKMTVIRVESVESIVRLTFIIWTHS